MTAAESSSVVIKMVAASGVYGSRIISRFANVMNVGIVRISGGGGGNFLKRIKNTITPDDGSQDGNNFHFSPQALGYTLAHYANKMLLMDPAASNTLERKRCLILGDGHWRPFLLFLGGMSQERGGKESE